MLLLLTAACDSPRCADSVVPLVFDETVRQSAIGELTPNSDALELFQSERAGGITAEHWLALVPGTSEQWGHHKAPPDGVLISDEYQRRLDRAAGLLFAGHVRFVFVSGGSVDAERPDYNEAERGKQYLVSKGVDARRVFLDPFAEHSTSNVRNADKLAVQLGLERILIVTTMPQGATLGPGDIATQGYYFLYHQISSFDSSAVSHFGYRLGSFARVYFGSEPAIVHCGFDSSRLASDDYGP